MTYTKNDVMEFAREEDVKFVRLAFCDVFGRQKNVSVMTDELDRAFEKGVAIDASAVRGFGDETKSDLFLYPDPSTLSVLPWRPEHGKVVRMFCDVKRPNGEPFECDTRAMLKRAVAFAEENGLEFLFGSETEFYLFKLDENGKPTKETYDEAGYMDIAPDDKGENIRREICLTLEQMGINPEKSHHEEGPGQNEIDFRYSGALQAAENAQTFRTVVPTVAYRNGLYSDFSPKPIENRPGNGFHINISAKSRDGKNTLDGTIAGILARVGEMTLFLNPCENSYERLGKSKAPSYIAWSKENRSPLIRIPETTDGSKRVELRSPDPVANPYIAFSLLIYAAVEGIKGDIALPEPADFNFFTASEEKLKGYDKLPTSLAEAKEWAKSSEFIKRYVPAPVLDCYLKFAK